MFHLNEGDAAPDFESQNERSETVKLADFRGKKLVLFFYPADNTPTCTTEACSLRDHYFELQKRGFAVVGVSPDSLKKHSNFKAKYSLPFPLLADADLKMAQAFGIFGEKFFMGRTFDGIHRTTFVINETGQIERIIRKVDSKNHAEQILNLI